MSTSTKLDVVFKGVDRTAKTLSGLEARIGASAKRMAGLFAGVFGARMLFEFGKESTALFQKQLGAEKKLLGVLNATEGAAGRSFNELTNMAGQLQKLTNFSDEDIINGQAILATFKNIRGEAFDRTTRVMLDMAAVMETDTKSAAILLGKALNDPVLGASALSRSGIQLTMTQKAMIKEMIAVNDIVGAQNVLFKELESEFGGVAESMADPLKQLANTWGDLREDIGNTVFGLIVFTGSAFAAGEGVEKLSAKLEGLSTKIFVWAQLSKFAIRTILVGIDILADAFGRLSVALETMDFETAFEGFEGPMERIAGFWDDAENAVDAFENQRIAAEALRTSFSGVGDEIKGADAAMQGFKNTLSPLTLAGTFKAIQRQFEKVQPTTGGRAPDAFKSGAAAGGAAEISNLLKSIVTNTQITASSLDSLEFQEI